MNKKGIIRGILFICSFMFALLFFTKSIYAFEKIITVPAEDPQGVTVNLDKGSYIVKIAGGSATLFYLINPNYRWFISIAAGTDVDGGQDEPNLGTLYFDPTPAVFSQAEAEQEAVKATQEGLEGTYLRFTLPESKKVRYWVSDFDYLDNSGMIKLKINKIN